MNDLLPLSIGIGLVVSLLLTELFGVAAAGMVVPGYVALQLTEPLDVIMTVGSGFVAYLVVRGVSSFTIVYGRRRTVLMILVGYLLGMALRYSNWTTPSGHAFDVIGYIIPGLIAIWFDRQGVVETLASLLTASAIVRLILILVVGTELWA